MGRRRLKMLLNGSGNSHKGLERMRHCKARSSFSLHWNSFLSLIKLMLSCVFLLSFISSCSTASNGTEGFNVKKAKDWFEQRINRSSEGDDQEQQLTTEQWRDVQRRLKIEGFNPGPIDGKPGSKTRNALSNFKRSKGLPADGLLTKSTMELLNNVKIEATKRDVPIAPKSTTVDDGKPLSQDNLSGIWSHTQIWESKSFGKREIKRNIPWVKFDIRKNGSRRYTVYRILKDGSLDPDSAQLRTRSVFDTFTLQLTTNTAAMRPRFSPYSVQPLRSKYGVDILTNVTVPTTRSSSYLIRFRENEHAREANIEEHDYDSFCSGPASRLSSAARAEDSALKKIIAADSSLKKRGATQRALILGLFGSERFKETIGKSYQSLSEKAKLTLTERLRICAIYHTNRLSGDMLLKALFGTGFNRERLRKDIGRSYKRNFPQEAVSQLYVNQYFAEARLAREALEKEKRALEETGLTGDELTVEKYKILSKHALALPPSEVSAELVKVASIKKNIAQQEAEEREKELDRTAPAKSESTLVLDATKKFLLRDCNRASLALRDKTGQSYIPLATARSVTAKGSRCVIESLTHLLSFNVRDAGSVSCSSGDPASCTFLAFWYCEYDLNPSFGFSSGTANIDPICPVVRNTPVKMNGVFQRKAPRRWIAQDIDW